MHSYLLFVIRVTLFCNRCFDSAHRYLQLKHVLHSDCFGLGRAGRRVGIPAVPARVSVEAQELAGVRPAEQSGLPRAIQDLGIAGDRADRPRGQQLAHLREVPVDHGLDPRHPQAGLGQQRPDPVHPQQWDGGQPVYCPGRIEVFSAISGFFGETSSAEGLAPPGHVRLCPRVSPEVRLRYI